MAGETSQRGMPAGPLLTRQEVADILRISVRTLDRLTKDGWIPAVRIGRGANKARYRRRYRPKDVERVIAKLTQEDDE